jgi:hypothetical protein
MTAPQQQKVRIAGPVVITANRLGDGKVVYRTADGGWVTQLDLAAVAVTATQAHAMLGAARADALHIVDPYIAPVAADAHGRALPANLRESIRRDGPTAGLPAQDRAHVSPG